MARTRRRLIVVAGALLLAGAALAPGSTASLPSAGTVATAADAAGARAIPIKAAKPAWLTPDLEQKVHAAAGAPIAAPAAAVDGPLPSEVGIRPGSWMLAPYGCTMNFVFRSGTQLGIGTAGHCTDRTGQAVILLTLAPGNGNPVLVDIGTVSKRVNSGIGADFALVTIRPALRSWVFPTIAVVGGPCGIYTGKGLVSQPSPFKGAPAYGPESVWHYGHGLGMGTGGTPRAGVGLQWERNAFYWASPSIFGDSGSPVRVTNLLAAGDLTHLVVDFPKHAGAVVAGTRISKMLSIASGWTLVRSPLCP